MEVRRDLGSSFMQPASQRTRYLIKKDQARFAMSPTIAECLENARHCEWCAARTDDEGDRKFLFQKSKDWTRLAQQTQRLREKTCALDS
jgi:hypothetical protein